MTIESKLELQTEKVDTLCVKLEEILQVLNTINGLLDEKLTSSMSVTTVPFTSTVSGLLPEEEKEESKIEPKPKPKRPSRKKKAVVKEPEPVVEEKVEPVLEDFNNETQEDLVATRDDIRDLAVQLIAKLKNREEALKQVRLIMQDIAGVVQLKDVPEDKLAEVYAKVKGKL